MGAETAIEWCNATFNPWIGCQRVSPGCENCYAEAYDKRVGGVPVAQRDPNKGGKAELRWGPTARRTRTSPAYWRQPIAWNKAAERAGERRRVFCASLADVFEDHQSIQRDWRPELFDLIRRTPALDWLLLTKRPENIRRLIARAIDDFVVAGDCAMATVDELLQPWVDGKAPANVWLGTTVEDQKRADERIPELMKVPAVVRFLSCEPLLENVDLQLDSGRETSIGWVDDPQPNWVIVGGESGPGARPFATDWAIGLVQQCRSAGAAPFVKQLGARPVDAVGDPLSLRDRHGGDWAEWPAGLRVREFPEARR